jgi:hypothetical protein
MNCPLCGEALVERGYFCKACARQVRCKSCREVLEPAAVACVECGMKIGEDAAQPTAPALVGAGALPHHRNTLSYEETRSRRTFHASLTDTAIQGLGEVFGDFFAPRNAVRPATQPRRFGSDGLALPSAKVDSANGGGYQEPMPAISQPEQPVGEQERVLKLFQPNGELLELKDNRLKAKSQSDFVRRLTYLVLYAHELHGRACTSYDALRTIEQAAKVWDANTRAWLAKRVGFTADGENNLKLTAPGREDAIKALNEALDPEIQDEWNPDKKVPRKLGPRKKT